MDKSKHIAAVPWYQSRDFWLKFLASSWTYLFLIAIIIFFSLTGRGFFTIRNFSNILVASTLVMMMAVGQTYVIITSGIDLSIAFTVGLASVICATVMRDLALAGHAIEVAIAAGVVAGMLVAIIPGLVNGYLVAWVRVPPFIATLGMYGIVRGASFLLTDGQQVVGGLPSNLRDSLSSIGNGSLLYSIPDIGLVFFNRPPDLTPVQLRGTDLLLPYPVIIAAIVVLVFGFILGRTQFGRHTYVIGGNEDAAIRAGINVKRHLLIIYCISAFTASIAGILHVFRFTGGSPLAGEQALLSSVAAVVIGGTNLFGGEGRLSGTVVGALIIATLTTGLVILNIDALWQFIIVGVIIIVAVLVGRVQQSLERRQLT
ncbi:MAG: ABC transporter permease [Anaerolineae bacterium]